MKIPLAEQKKNLKYDSSTILFMFQFCAVQNHLCTAPLAVIHHFTVKNLQQERGTKLRNISERLRDFLSKLAEVNLIIYDIVMDFG